MAKKKQLNGWMVRHRIGYKEVIDPVVPTKWETMLKDLGVDEESVFEVLKQKSDRTRLIQMWVRKNAHVFFVPESVLEACGMDRRWI